MLIKTAESSTFVRTKSPYIDEDEIYDIINYLNSNPLVRYYFAFEEKLNVYIKEGLISKNNIFSAAQNYLLDSDDVEGIKYDCTKLFNDLGEGVYYAAVVAMDAE